MRRGSQGIASNPVLIGAATTLVIIVAVFLAYNANSGLPFVPSYQLKAEVPSAANLVVGNDVRIGGSRIGSINDIGTRRRRDGSVVATLTMQLQRSVSPLPRDSKLLVRTRSALGLKYVEISQGSAEQGFQDGDTIPVANSTPAPVEIDEVFNTFDEATRAAVQRNLKGYGDAFAGRGKDINTALGEFNPLLRDLLPVMRNLSDDRTQLARFFRSLGDAAAAVAPVAGEQADLFVNLDTTFAALRRVRGALQETISEGPETLDVATAELPGQRPFLANSEGFFRELRPGVRALRTGAPALAGAFTTGTPVLRRSVAFNQRLEPLLRSLQRFSQDPLVPRGLRRLTETVGFLKPTLEYVTPAQSVCNYATLFFKNTASLLSDGDANGTWQRFIIIDTPTGPNSEGGPASAPADGPDARNHLHTNPYPIAAGKGQTKECEAGNENFVAGQTVLGNIPGNQGTATQGQPEKDGD